MTLTLSSLLYAIVICVLFILINKRYRLYLLTIASLLYVFVLNRLAGEYVLLASLFCWGAGLVVSYLKEKDSNATDLVANVFVAIIIASLAVLKYVPVHFASILEGQKIFKYLIMPIGFSFYSFSAISYIIDIKRGITKASWNPFVVTLYLSFFPKFISGPIERFKEFRSQLGNMSHARVLDPERWKRALYYTIYGCFFKLVIADRLQPYVDRIFEGYKSYGSLFLIMGSLMYTIQIYCDFAGYSYVAIGIAEIFGIRLSDNFRQPYCSSNITEFWRRWHMSLSRFLMEYLYIPLGGNRKGRERKIINTMIVFLVCGMWHGAGLNFIAWGLLHGIYSAVDSIAKERENLRWIRTGVTGHVITFLEASFAWIFFKASSLSSAIKYVFAIIAHIFMRSDTPQMELLELTTKEFRLIIILVIIMAVLDIVAYRKGKHIPELIAHLPQGRRYICLYVLIVTVVILGIYGPDMSVKPIYMGF